MRFLFGNLPGFFIFSVLLSNSRADLPPPFSRVPIFSGSLIPVDGLPKSPYSTGRAHTSANSEESDLAARAHRRKRFGALGFALTVGPRFPNPGNNDLSSLETPYNSPQHDTILAIVVANNDILINQLSISSQPALSIYSGRAVISIYV